MTTKHTPGPWRVDPDNDGDVQSSDGKLEIACTSSAVLVGGQTPKIDEQRANARLIASAPELLEALDTLTLVIGLTPVKSNLGPLQEAFDIARAAIAKAKGE